MYPTAMRNTPPPERQGVFFGYVAVVCVAAITLTAMGMPHLAAHISRSSDEFWILAGLAVISDAWPVTTPGGRSSLTVFPSICFTFAIMLMFGVAAAVVVQAAAVVVSSVQLRHAPWRGLFNASQYALSFVAAGYVLHSAHGMPFAAGNEPGWADVLLAALSGSVWFVVNYTLVTAAVGLRFGGSWWRLVRRSIAFDALTTGALLLLAPVLVGAAHFSAALIPLVLLPLIAVNRLARLFNEQDRIASTDPLTRLPNRTALMTEMAAQVALCSQRFAADGRVHHFALLVLDIDRFKYVNDALGHDVGDRLLAEIASRLRRAAPNASMVARLGGDEYAVVAPDVETAEDALHMAERVSDELSVPPVVLDGLSLDVGVSIGIVMYPEHGDDCATLMRHADVAMYEAKTRGDTVALYASEADHNSPARLGLLADLRRALEDPACTDVTFYYQPQVEMATGQVVGVEALLRWHHPERGLIDPEELIRLAEHSGVMRLLTLRVVDDVVAQLAAWRESGLTLRAAINVSVRDLHTSEIVDRLAERLTYHEVEPDILQLEITESALMADPRQVLSTLQRLRKIGIALSLDDFGTGYSSMQHLRRLPLAEVKIDRSFVLGMADDGDDEAIVRSIIELAGALGLRVVAEGVEDDRTRRLLVAAGCHLAQGWFYARPMPADDLVGWLARYRAPQTRVGVSDADPA